MNTPTPLQTVTAALDAELRLQAFNDSAHNGLQVANSGKVTKICCGVDASLDFLREAHVRGADLCIAHHGISWGDSLAKITGPNYDLLSFLIRNDMALYAAHLPLDAHPTLGNNAGLADAIGLIDRAPFCQYHGNTIGIQGRLPSPIPFTTLCAHIRTVAPCGPCHALPFGCPQVQTIGIVSGGAAAEIPQAAEAGLDCYITGEMDLQGYNAAKAWAINVIAAGHYATERFGVQALGRFLNQTLKIPYEFADFDLPW